MENASKALIMAAEILIAMMVASMFVLMFSTMSQYSEQYSMQKEAEEVEKFNVQFLKYSKDATIQDILTLYNLAKEYNTDTGNTISINIAGESTPIDTTGLLNQGYGVGPRIKRYNIKESLTKYDNPGGRVSSITFELKP